MNEAIKSIALGVLTITVLFVASLAMNNDKDNGVTQDNRTKEQTTFMETLTIDYEGDTKKI